MDKIEIVLCMGSSCYTRGNNNTVQVIENFINELGLKKRVTFKGELCSCNCKNGPSLRIGPRKFGNVDAASALKILEDQFVSAGLLQ